MSTTRWREGGVLVLGARGMLGRDLMGTLGEPVEKAGGRLAGLDLPTIDICDREAVDALLSDHRVSTVINAAAFTDVDGCESRCEHAMAVNAEGPAHVAAACGETGATLVHISTDFIFDGQSDTPYPPNHPANPLSIYGRSKWMGEQAVRESDCRHLIVRTSWLFGHGGRNFVEAILDEVTAGKALRVVHDQVGSPTYARHLANAVVRLLDVGATGTVHFANAGQCSWFEFAAGIVSLVGADVPITRINAAELGRPAKRPAYSVLDTTGFTEETGHRPAAWPDALADYIAKRSTAARTAEHSGA